MRSVVAAEQAEGSESLLSLWLLSHVVPELRGELEHGGIRPANRVDDTRGES